MLIITVVVVVVLGCVVHVADTQTASKSVAARIDPAMDVDGDGIVDCAEVQVCGEMTPPPASEPAPIVDQELTGVLGSIGFNVVEDRDRSWWIHDATLDGDGADATLYAVGTRCRIERATIFGGKHGIRMASVNGLVIEDCNIRSDPSNKGKALKICGAWGRAPASRGIEVEDCTIAGIVSIQPQSKDPRAAGEVVEHVMLRDCVIKPYGNTAIEIAAKHILIEGCVFDFRGTATPYGRGVSVRTYNTVVPEDVTVRNCTLLLRGDQKGEMYESEIPIRE